MLCYRLYEDIPSRSPLGYGPGGGRWNYAGTPIIYSSNLISLCFLELYSIRGSVVAETKWNLAGIEIPHDLPTLEMEGAPKNWSQRPASTSTKDLGTTWALTKESPCLRVPSARMPLLAYPKEHNILINPLHPDFTQTVKLLWVKKVSFAIQ